MTITYELDGNLYVNLTNQCQNNCDFCVRNLKSGIDESLNLWLEREPTPEEVKDAVLAADFSRYKELIFCGYGEPMTRLDALLYAAKAVKETASVPIRINTNGLANLIHERNVVPDLVGVIDKISISLNAKNAKEYDAICHSFYGEQAFDAMLDFAKKCHEAGIDTVLSIVDVIPPEDIEACRALAKRIGVPLRVREEIK